MLSPILSVNDISVSIHFYVDALGFTENWCMNDDDGTPNFACVKLGDAEILLGTIDFVDEADRHKRGIGIQLYVEVPAGTPIDDIYATAQNITRDIETRAWGERAFNVKDPDGYSLMLAQRLSQ